MDRREEGKEEGWGGLGGESAAGMMCCGVAGKKRRRRERRLGRGEDGEKETSCLVLFVLFRWRKRLAVAVLTNPIPEFVEWRTNIIGWPIHSVSFIHALSQIVNLPEAAVTEHIVVFFQR